jgi:hypothetical protein
MSRGRKKFSICAGLLSLMMLCPVLGWGQYRIGQGHSIGAITTQGNLIVLTLDEGVLGKANLFDLAHRTLRFTPDGPRYRVENLPLQWDSEFGAEMTGSHATLTDFSFPFSGKSWNSFSVGVTGSITFGEPATGSERGIDGGNNRSGGLSVRRFAELQQAGPGFINTVPAISVFFKPRMSGVRYLKESDDRAVITWSLTEPFGGIQDGTWKPTVNRFQAVLRKDGTIDLSYDQVAARDAIIGIYPMATGDAEKNIATISVRKNTAIAPYLNIKSVKLAAVDGLFLKATIETRGPIPPASDPRMAGVTYRICMERQKAVGDCIENAPADAVWTIWDFRWRGRNGDRQPRYIASGLGVLPTVKVDGNTISMQGTLPEGYKTGDRVFLYASVQTSGTPPATADRVLPHSIKLTGLYSPAVHFSSINKQDGPFQAVYETFHYMKPPRAVDLTCTVIQALGDKFDMLAYYSDFRIDNPEAGTSSDGPLGGGPAGGAVTGIGAKQENLANYCTKGRFQWQFIQPVYVGANQMQEYPPEGLTGTDPHNIATYTHQLAERTSNGKIPPYDYAMSQIGHEMGHRWSAFVSAKVNGETIQLGPVHWAKGLQARVPFPYQRPTEASAMGGGVWQDNFYGTYTQLDDNYYVPATGYSYLDLYLMGLISPAEVPDFFILRNLKPVGHDSNGHPIFKADRTKITIQDVIAAEGPRLPDVNHSQKEFNTGMVVVVEHGKMPSPELIERTNGIRDRWMDYWTTTTGHRSTMATNP